MQTLRKTSCCAKKDVYKRQPKYRIIDFKRDKDNVPGTVKTIEYDPNRSANIALIVYADGEKRYIIAPNKLEVGQVIVSGPEADIVVGNALPIANIPVGTIIHNVELKPGKGDVYKRQYLSWCRCSSAHSA